jgi:hypothetical protein
VAPQGLKPASFEAFDGTAEAVPFHRPIMKHALVITGQWKNLGHGSARILTDKKEVFGLSVMIRENPWSVFYSANSVL